MVLTSDIVNMFPVFSKTQIQAVTLKRYVVNGSCLKKGIMRHEPRKLDC